jgi:nitrogen regulatory protein P-II 1
MKLIKCIIRPNKVDDVRHALEKASVAGMTVTEVRGHGRQKGHKAIYRGREYDVSLLPKTTIEMVVSDDLVDEVIRVVMQTARTGDIGDGRIFVLPVDDGHNIRTGERDAM